ncbi:MAG: hypothetical protein K0Q77_1628 [Anaerosporomusa subterranea]|nr:hypothetical protein [Anaerosporomusa subterranea]
MTMLAGGTVLAIDAGGTSCRALLCSQSGEVLGYAQGGPANYHSIGERQARKVMTILLQSLPYRPSSVECAVFGLAGLDTRKDREVLTAVAVDTLRAAAIQTDQLLLENDGMVTLIGATGGSDGLLIIAGTGSIACGVALDGRRVRVGGWGSRAGDEGSGYCIGMDALRHALRTTDGREKQSGICAVILQEKGMVDVEELINWLYSSDFSVDSVAALAPAIFTLADNGDWQARTIVNNALSELSLMAATVIDKLALSDTNLHTVLAGGILEKNSWLREQLAQSIQRLAPQAHFAPAVYPPIVGGLLLGLRASGGLVPGTLQRIMAGMP